MNKIIFIIIFLFNLLAFSNNSKKIIVALSLNDCANCSVALYHINEKLNDPDITFILKSHLKVDSLLVNNRTGIYEFKRGTVKYSDSLFNKYANGIKSTINIVENNKIIHSSLLLEVKIDEFLKIYNSTENEICFNKLKEGVKYIQYDNSLLVYNSELYRWSYYDKNNELDIVADNDWVKKIYEAYYNSIEAQERFKEYELVVKQYPNIYPVVSNGTKINDNEILFVVDINFFKKEIGKENTDIIKRQFFINYNIKEKKFETIRYLNTENSILAKKYYINSRVFHTFNNNYIIPIITLEDATIDSKYLAIFEINKNNPNELTLKNIIDKNIPSNYIKYKIYNNLHGYCFDKSLVLLKYGEFIYDLEKNKQYKIPFPQEAFDKLDNIVANLVNGDRKGAYYIADISDQGKTILLLYKDSNKDLKLMEIDKQTEKAIKDEVLLSSIELDVYKYIDSFSFNEKGEVHFLYNNNCITILNSNK